MGKIPAVGGDDTGDIAATEYSDKQHIPRSGFNVIDDLFQAGLREILVDTLADQLVRGLTIKASGTREKPPSMPAVLGERAPDQPPQF